MKDMNKIKICILCLLTIMLFSCKEDFENFESKAYINSDSKLTTYLIKPDVSTYSASLNIVVPKPATQDVEFTFKADASLVGSYNNIFSDNAVILPSDYYTISKANVKIAKESVRSTDIDIEFNDINQLDRNTVYVLPVTIANAGMQLVESARTHYYLFKGGALINWAGDIEENYFPVKWGNSSLVSGMSEITIESMLYLRQAERDGSDSHIMTFFGVENGFLIRLGDTFEAGQVMVVKGSGKYPDNANDRTKAPVGKWFHLAVTYDSSNLIKIYIDGVLKSTSTASSGTISVASNCYIGYSYNSNRWWPGMIAETRVWNKARTQEDIAAYMYAVNTDAEGLVAYWKFDEGNGNTITDYSGNNTSITANSALKWTSVSLPEE